MDLGAYAQIEELEHIMKENDIKIPRLRGLRLMKNEKPISKEEFDEMAFKEGLSRCEELCHSRFSLNYGLSEYSDYTDAIARYYLKFEENRPIGIRWDRVHGKKRKVFKYVIKKAKKDVYAQYEMWNKYCGREDVLYIHCRLGDGNYLYYHVWDIIESKPWFLDDVEDYFDHTYLDVYAKIKIGGEQ